MTVLVVGANGTIGSACVAAARSLGRVVAADLKEPVFSGTSNKKIDVIDLDNVVRLVDEIESESPLTGFIYAAGLNTTGPLDGIDWMDYERVMGVNLKGAFHFGSAILAALRKKPRQFGSVFISSTAGLIGEAGGSIYCASKFALIGFTQSFAGEIASFGGRANVVAPGNVDSPMLSGLAAKIGERENRPGDEVLRQWMRSSAFQRLITPEEVAATSVWLVSDQASGVSGQTVVVDGARA